MPGSTTEYCQLTLTYCPTITPQALMNKYLTTMGKITLNHPEDYLVYRPGGGGTVEIHDIHVGSDRRKGCGRTLLEILFSNLPEDTTVWAITRADNEIAQHFYEATQFRVAGVLRRFYDCRTKGVDAIVYARRAGGPV